MSEIISETDWLAVILAVLAAPPVSAGVRWVWKRWREPFTPKTQSKKDRRNYDLLLHQYEGYLDLFCDLIVIRARIEAGPSEYTPEMERKFITTRDGIYGSLETRAKHEKGMGIFQKLDILEGRMVGGKQQRDRRTALENRQDAVEEHPWFIRRDMD